MTQSRSWKPLTSEHIDELITLAVQAHELAHRTPSMRRLAAYLIKLAVWRFTADAVDIATNIVIPDAIKYDIRFLNHSAEAAAIARQYPKELSKRLTHEHSFPLSLIAEKIFSLRTGNREEIREIFFNYCRAAIVTREEDRKLSGSKLRSAMPFGWNPGDEILARYSAVGIQILPPTG